jgi:large subunit ribosomal protein L24
MMAKKIRKGDQVIVISGSCKKKIGKVLEVCGDRVIVDQVNKRLRSIKKTNEAQGRIEAFFAPIHVSNVAHCINDKPVKVGFSMINSKKHLINKHTQESIRSVW